MKAPAHPRRSFLQAAALGAASATTWGSNALAQAFDFKPNQRYPDPAIEILDPSFTPYRLYSSTVEQICSGLRWAEGPVYFGDGRYLLFSDVPNNRIMRYDETTGQTNVFRSDANFANGMCRDTRGRLVVCEHLTRRVTPGSGAT